MPAIGEMLREARMRQHLDVGDVESRTKIRAKYLRALENEDFGMLPGPTFVKSFLRTYADFLGLDSQLLLEEYRARFEPRDEGELQRFGARPGEHRERPHRGPPRRGLVVGGAVLAAIVVLLLVLGLTSGGGGGGNEGKSGAARSGKRAAPKPARRPVQPRLVKLRIVPVGPTYICVANKAGRVIDEETITTPRRFRGRLLRLNLGRRSARVVVNGRAVPIPPSAEPAGYEFAPGRGPRPLPPSQRPCVLP